MRTTRGSEFVYSCAEICWSESRHALIFSRRQTQQRSSPGLGPAGGVQEAPHTAHGLSTAGLGVSTDFFAISKICGEMTGSGSGFFFIAAFTIEQKLEDVGAAP
jgi:hypothetical protein